eukprot:2301655-Alexandrium_andersonii.AAC.1
MPTSLQVLDLGRARARKQRQRWPQRLWTGSFCAIVHADSEPADETGRRVRQRLFSGGSGRGRSPPGKP